MTIAIDWIRAHSFAILCFLTAIVAAIPIVANVAIRILRARSKSPNDRAARVANWIAAEAPLVRSALRFAEDVVAHPEQLLELADRLESEPTIQRVATTVVALRDIGQAKRDTPSAPFVPPGVTGLLLALALVGCARPIDTAVAVVNASKVTIIDAHDGLRDAETQELERAVAAAPSREQAEATTAAIEKKYLPWWLRYDDVRLAWIAARATVEEARALDAGHLDPSLQDIVTALAVLGHAWGNFAMVVGPQILGKPVAR